MTTNMYHADWTPKVGDWVLIRPDAVFDDNNHRRILCEHLRDEQIIGKVIRTDAGIAQVSFDDEQSVGLNLAFDDLKLFSDQTLDHNAVRRQYGGDEHYTSFKQIYNAVEYIDRLEQAVIDHHEEMNGLHSLLAAALSARGIVRIVDGMWEARMEKGKLTVRRMDEERDDDGK